MNVKTPAAVAAIRGTDWSLSVDGSGKTALVVLEGVVELRNAQGSVTVRQGDERVIARGEPLEREGGYLPMTRLTLNGDRVTREDRWPTDADLGAIVILPGGEAGVLTAWWNAPDGSAEVQTVRPMFSRLTWWQMPVPGGTTLKLSSALEPHFRNS